MTARARSEAREALAGLDYVRTRLVELRDRFADSGEWRAPDLDTLARTLADLTSAAGRVRGRALAINELIADAAAHDDDTPRHLPVAAYHSATGEPWELRADPGAFGFEHVPWLFVDVDGCRVLSLDRGRLGFFGKPPAPRPVVTGSTGEEIARSLAAALDALGLVSDETS